MIRSITNRNFWIMLVGDALLVFATYYLAYYIRFDGTVPSEYLSTWQKTVPWIIPVKLICFVFFAMYRGMWRYTSLYDLINVVKACILSSTVIIVLLAITTRFAGISRGVLIIDFFLTFLLIGGYRIIVRLHYYKPPTNASLFRARRASGRRRKILIIGAGNAGEKLIREIRENPGSSYDVIGFIDDDRQKTRHTIHGVTILGTLQELEKIVRENNIDEIIIAAPSASALQMRRMVNFCKTCELPYKTLPGLYELVEGKVSVNFLREVRYEDLLGREPVSLEIEEIGEYLKGKRVLVSGGAGSIGSELCRQIAQFYPERIIIVERNESGLYEIELELIAKHPELKVVGMLGAIQHNGRLEKVFQEQRPDVVFHTAAYKHVPMMEVYPWEAIYNNILGTRAILELCQNNSVERCVVVSTDKAVRPTNVMGASKRVVEMLTQAYAAQNQGRYMAVRFGNVVGSVGSVIPLFKRQIEMGGPVTVTHPEVTRYFMTIPEACSLILQAGAIGSGGEIFVLKMGTPIRIIDMARDIITLSGLKPDEDIEIKYIGLRAGEKLFEELITEGEGIQPTVHKDIMVLNTDCCPMLSDINQHVDRLAELARTEDVSGIKEELKRIVPEYEPQY